MNGITTKWLAALNFLSKWIPLAGKILSGLLTKAGTAVETAKDLTTKVAEEANNIKEQVKDAASDIKEQVGDLKDSVKAEVKDTKPETK